MTGWPTKEEATEAISHGRGKGVRIALIDSGVETSHPALAGLTLRDEIAFAERDGTILTEPGDGQDAYGHGTAIAGILRAFAPEAEIGSFRVLGPQLSARAGIIAAAAEEAIGRGYHILNCSFGCSIPAHFHRFKLWLDAALLSGVHVIAACSNAARNCTEWPAHYPTVIAVDIGDGPEGSDSLELQRNPGDLIGFSAPGFDIRVAWAEGGYRVMTGSSFAAPHATALLARLISVYPKLPPLLAKGMLEALALPA
jgi:subtilisin